MDSLDLTGHPHAPVRWRSTWMWGVPLSAVVLGSVAVGLLLDGVMERGDLSRYDPALTASIIADRSPVLTALAGVLTFLGSEAVLAPLSLLLVVALVVVHRRLAALAVVGGMGLSVTLTLVLKHLVARARPAAVDLVGAVDTGFAFPSGHTLNSTVFYGLLAGLLVLSSHTARTRVVIVAGWLVLAIGVGASRVYLGYHWMTDVLGGWALGIAVLGAVALAHALLWGRRTITSRRYRSEVSQNLPKDK